MLATLRVRDLVLIERLDLELHSGFNVLTGETGAGKSILIEAIGLSLGSRSKTNLVRAGSDTAEVEALFDITDDESVAARIGEAGWEVGEELLVRRTIPAEGRSRCYVNGHPVPLTMLATLSRGLAELSSQHEHHSLTDPSTHLFALDAFADLSKLRASVKAAYANVLESTRALERLETQVAEKAQRVDLLRYHLDQLEGLAPLSGEEEDLRQEREVLRSSTKLLEAARGGEERLYSSEGAACETLSTVSSQLGDAAVVDPALKPLTQQLDEALALVEDVADQLRRYVDGFDVDPGRLDFIEDRLAAYTKVRKMLGPGEQDLNTRMQTLRSSLLELDHHDELVAEARSTLQKVMASASEVATALSSKRKALARKLARAFGQELADLGMGQAKIEVRVEPASGGEPSINGARLTETGIDRVEFLIAPNPGEPASPLRDIASGGELSRAALALKRALSGVGPVGTYVFDEADAGISGAVADMVGRKLLEVSRYHQVLCVTHLPQVAALADAHFKVSKRQRGKRTVTEICLLDKEGQIDEIAAMISGSQITARSRAAAEELIRARESTQA